MLRGAIGAQSANCNLVLRARAKMHWKRTIIYLFLSLFHHETFLQASLLMLNELNMIKMIVTFIMGCRNNISIEYYIKRRLSKNLKTKVLSFIARNIRKNLPLFPILPRN